MDPRIEMDIAMSKAKSRDQQERSRIKSLLEKALRALPPESPLAKEILAEIQSWSR